MINSLFQGVFDWLKSACIEPSLKVLKLRAAIYYLEAVRKAHRILILVCVLVFVITLIGAGLVMVPMALLLFMPWDPATKAVVGIAVGGLYLILPVVALITLLSEKRWMRLTGATDVLRKMAS